MKHKEIMIPLFLCLGLIFDFSLPLFFSSSENEVYIRISNLQDDTYVKLIDVAKKNGRKHMIIDGNSVTLTSENRLAKWLTTEIKIIKTNEETIIKIPSYLNSAVNKALICTEIAYSNKDVSTF